jgi:predicted nucleotidyltransferase
LRPSAALQDHLEQVRAVIARYPVRNARFFGSASRGDDRDGSDLDILVEPTEVTTLFDLAGLKLELEGLLGVHVDIATPGALPAKVDRAISDDLRPL